MLTELDDIRTHEAKTKCEIIKDCLFVFENVYIFVPKSAKEKL